MMTDMRTTIIPKSDQINADDLIGRTMTIKVTKVLLTTEADQPVAIHFEGDNGKPYKACKSMRRVLVNVWGPDGNAYIGRSMTIYRDDKVQFGGLAVGGIRISHMSDIEAPVTMALTATRANRKPFTVKPLVAPTKLPETTGKRATIGDWLAKFKVLADECNTVAEFDAMKDSDEMTRVSSTFSNGAKSSYDTIVGLTLDRLTGMDIVQQGMET